MKQGAEVVNADVVDQVKELCVGHKHDDKHDQEQEQGLGSIAQSGCQHAHTTVKAQQPYEFDGCQEAQHAHKIKQYLIPVSCVLELHIGIAMCFFEMISQLLSMI